MQDPKNFSDNEMRWVVWGGCSFPKKLKPQDVLLGYTLVDRAVTPVTTATTGGIRNYSLFASEDGSLFTTRRSQIQMN